MAHEKRSRYAVAAFTALLFLIAIDCHAQEGHQGHSCTVDAAGSVVFPKGEDGHNFGNGWGLQAGGGFAVTRVPKSHGASLFITANYMHEQLIATAAALAAAKTANPSQLANATSAHGVFSAVSLDPTVRFALDTRLSFYGSGGFGWFRRSVGFQGANPATLLESSGVSLDRLASNSGAFDLGGGANFGLTKGGGLMLFAEMRVYHGTAINKGTTLVPLSFGIRW